MQVDAVAAALGRAYRSEWAFVLSATVPDDRLRLVFTCCHPTLAPEARGPRRERPIVVALWDGVKRTWAKILRQPPPKPVDATKLVPITSVMAIRADRNGRHRDLGRHLQPALA